MHNSSNKFILVVMQLICDGCLTWPTRMNTPYSCGPFLLLSHIKLIRNKAVGEFDKII